MNKTIRVQKNSSRRLTSTKLCYDAMESRQMLAGDSFWVYYGEGNKLFRSLNDGSQKQELMALTIQPGNVNADGIMIDLDRVANKIYAIANQGHNPIHLYRSNLDGTNRELLNNSDSMGTILQGIAVNEQTSTAYVSPHSLQVRSPGSPPGGMLKITNGGQTVTALAQKPWYVTDMEVDSANGHVYYAVWPSYGPGNVGWSGIRRMNLDGSNDIQIFETGGNGSFALDISNNRIWLAASYSSILQSDRIYSINLNGGGLTTRSIIAGYSIGDLDLSESKESIVFHSFPNNGSSYPNPRIQQLLLNSSTATPLFDTPNITSGIELLTANAPPTLDEISNLTLNEDSGQQTINLTGISAGGGLSQPLRVSTSSNNVGLIANPTVSYNSPNAAGSVTLAPTSNKSGVATITVTVEDGGLDSNLGTTADNATFSRSFTVTVNSVNDAPLLEASASPSFSNLTEGATNPNGLSVASLLVDGSVTDADGNAVEAIALTAANASLGTWQYRLDGNGIWQTIDTRLLNSQTNELALLLGPNAQLRLLPFRNLNGSLSDAITFRAWDQTTGSEGQYTIISSSGGTTSYSSVSDSASIIILPQNNAPTFFIGSGRVSTAIGPSGDVGYSVNVQSDGKILVGGHSRFGNTEDFALVRYNPDGSLDTTFGSSGIVTTGLGSFNDYMFSVVIQPNGKILVGGRSDNSSSADSALARYNSDGSLDTTFGTAGKVVISFSSGNDEIYSIALQPDGKIITAGYSNVSGNGDILIARYTINGALDTTFGNGGKVTTVIGPGSEEGYSLAVQADGKILVGGQSASGSTRDFALVRYNSDGSLDTAFGNAGKITTDFAGGNDEGRSVSLLMDGKILIGGFAQVGGNTDFAIVRYNANGSLDSSFGTAGKVTTPIGIGADEAYSLAVQTDGKILVSGKTWNGTNFDICLARYNTNGSPDLSFGAGGKTTASIGIGVDVGFSITVQPDGAILVAGYTHNGTNDDFALLRYNSTGILDASFNITNTLGGTVPFLENGSPVILDNNVGIFDAELSESNSFSGATLTLSRSGGSSSEDNFFSSGTLGPLIQGGSLLVGSAAIGTVTTNSGGTLVLTFNSNATNTLVNAAMRQIAYGNGSDAPPTSVQINWVFNDANSGGQGSGGPLTAQGSVSVSITPVNDAPTLDPLSDLSVVEDAPQQSISLSGISAGGGESQPLRITATSSNLSLIPTPSVNYSSPNQAGAISFTSIADQFGTATITVTVEDGGPDGNLSTTADNLSISRAFQVNVSAVNEPPTLNPISNLVLEEDSLESFVDLLGITAGGTKSQPLRVIALSNNTTLLPNPTVNYQSPSPTGALRLLPGTNQFGTASVTVTVEDGGTDQDLATIADNLTVSRSFTVTITPVNDSPKVDNFGGDVNFTENGSAISIATAGTVTDPDTADYAGGRLSVRFTNSTQPDDRLLVSPTAFLTVNGQNLQFAGVTVATWSGGTAGVPLRIDFLAQAFTNRVQHILQNIAFQNNSEAPGSTPRQIVVELTDGVGGSSSDHLEPVKQILVNESNDLPTFSNFGGNLNYFEGDVPTQLANSLILSDPDSPDFGSGQAIIQITSGAEATDRLVILPNGSMTVTDSQVLFNGVLVATFSGGSGSSPLTINFTSLALRSRVQQILQSLAFQSVADEPGLLVRTVTFRVSDGDGGNSTTFGKQIQVLPRNDAPKVANLGGTVNYVEAAAPILIADSATVSDVDSLDFSGGQLAISFQTGYQLGDELSLVPGGGLSISGSNLLLNGSTIGTISGGSSSTPLLVTFGSSATTAAVQTTLRQVAFRHLTESPSAQSRLLAVSLTDGDGGSTGTLSKQVSVTPVNNPPLIGGIGGLQYYKKNSSAVFIASGATLNDVDNTNFLNGKLTVRITGGASIGNRLLIGGGFGVDSNGGVWWQGQQIGNRNPGGGIDLTNLEITFNANATTALVQELMRSIQFQTVKGKGSTNRTIQFQLTDGLGGTSNLPSKQVTFKRIKV